MIESHSARKQTRAPVELTPRYRTPASFEYVEGRCIDLSEGGMFIAAPLPCENGTLLKFECAVDGQESVVKGVARVVWRRSNDGDRPSGMGLKFVKLEPGSPEVISQLVSTAREHGTTAPEAPLSAQVRKTDSFVVSEPPKPAPEAMAAAETDAASAVTPAITSLRGSPAPAMEQVSERALAPLPPRASGPATGALPHSKTAPSSGATIWIALAAGGALLIWLLMR